MEKYSFIKFIKNKKKEIIKEIKYLKSQTGGSNAKELNTNILRIYELLTKLKSIKGLLKNPMVQNYETLSKAIKLLEEQITKNESTSQPLEQGDKINLIEKLKLIEDRLNPDIYKVTYGKEMIWAKEPVSTDTLVKPVIDSITQFSEDINKEVQKINLQSNQNDINKLEENIKTKNEKLDNNIQIMEQIKTNLQKKIDNMKQLFKFTIDSEVDEPIEADFDKIKIIQSADESEDTGVESEPDDKLIASAFTEMGALPVSTKYYKKNLKINIDKNIKNLHNEWIETLENYRNKLKDKLDTTIIGGTHDTKNKLKNKLKNNILIGGSNMINLHKEFIIFQEKILLIREKYREISKLIKRYNVMYIQLINFQNFITNFVSIKIAQGGYTIYTRMNKGIISFFDSLLTGLKEKMDIFDKKYSYPIKKITEIEQLVLNSTIYKWFYKNHYFMINILHAFFDKLYKIWEARQWNMLSDIETNYNSTKPIVSQMFFLFTTFYELLMEYRKKFNKRVANYIRINKIPTNADVETFKKQVINKNFLDSNSLNLCTAGSQYSHDISKIKFEEIFDPENFQDNATIPMYMGLSNFINSKESIVTVTYGYSGVGKTYTLFGGKSEDKYVEGMLQRTLTDIREKDNISVKIFELYGLGVPYAFYWKTPKTLNHSIFDYKIQENNDIQVTEHPKDENGTFATYLDFKQEQYYTRLSSDKIKKFSEYIEKIDKIRKETGRIKKTINNPESSRSIMIYDFLIKIKEVGVHFVIIDLPGKENIYETYCNINNDLTTIKETFMKHDNKNISDVIKQPIMDNNSLIDKNDPSSIPSILPSTPSTPSTPTSTPVPTLTSEQYSIILIKLIIFVNPLWASMIPEIAHVFDNKKKTFDPFNPDQEPSYTGLTLYNSMINRSTTFSEFHKIVPNATDKNVGKSYSGRPLFNSDYAKNPENNKFKFAMLRLRGVYERALYTIVGFIKEGKLIELGRLLDTMLVNSDKTKEEKQEGLTVNYGHVGLEAFYINENILGLLQVLANKVRTDSKLRIKPVVCPQNEYYSKIISTQSDYNYMLHFSIVQDDEVYKGKKISDDEFFSQLHFINEFEKQNFVKRIQDKQNQQLYDNTFRDLKDVDFTSPKTTRDIPIHFGQKYTDMLNNYDYNKSFNLENPPIQSILAPYLHIQNIFLFFVVTNNKNKKDDSTCDKQMKLLYDTRTFMDVVAGIDSGELKCL